MVHDQVSLISDESSCRLCGQASIETVYDYGQKFQLYVCPVCKLLMKNISALPGREEERARYLFHQNSPENEGYVSFLHSFLERIFPYIPRNCRALDFGCGPHPVLADILTANGIGTEVYDPFFFPQLPEGQFDLITCTETAEHFHSPNISFQAMIQLLGSGGVLALMTEFYPPIDRLKQWYYLRDSTHVSFYNLHTMHYIAKVYGLKLLYTDLVRTVVFQK